MSTAMEMKLFALEHEAYLVDEYGKVCAAAGYTHEELERFLPSTSCC